MKRDDGERARLSDLSERVREPQRERKESVWSTDEFSITLSSLLFTSSLICTEHKQPENRRLSCPFFLFQSSSDNRRRREERSERKAVRKKIHFQFPAAA